MTPHPKEDRACRSNAAPVQDFVDHLRERRGGVDRDTVRRDRVFVLEIDRDTLRRRLAQRGEGEWGGRQVERDLARPSSGAPVFGSP
ncbi:MAG TPA: hypothetical protein VGG10_15340 [Rhizomicrobium sp.]